MGAADMPHFHLNAKQAQLGSVLKHVAGLKHLARLNFID
jgi:hypothetical protein